MIEWQLRTLPPFALKRVSDPAFLFAFGCEMQPQPPSVPRLNTTSSRVQPPQSARTARAASARSQRNNLTTRRRPTTARQTFKEGQRPLAHTSCKKPQNPNRSSPVAPQGDSGPLRQYQKPEVKLQPVESWRGGATYREKDLTPWRKENWTTGWGAKEQRCLVELRSLAWKVAAVYAVDITWECGDASLTLLRCRSRQTAGMWVRASCGCGARGKPLLSRSS